MGKLTDKSAFSGVLNDADIVHIVDVSDTSQDPAGSSYKLTVAQLKAAITAPYKVYSALISQIGTAAPTVTVLQNTIGAIVWTRSGMGIYAATLAGAFPVNKVALIDNGFTNSSQGKAIRLQWFSANAITLFTAGNESPYTQLDSVLSKDFIEIRVYP